MRFSIIQERPNSPFTFQLLDNQEDVILTSGAYPNRDACTEAIRAAIEALRDPESFGILAGNAIALRDANGTQLARSSALPSRQAATQGIANIVSTASQTTRFDVTVTTRSAGSLRQTLQNTFQRVSQEELTALYNFARTSGAPGFELYQLEDDQLYYFHFNDTRGQTLLYGRGFSAGAKRDRRLEAVIKTAGNKSRYDILEENGGYYFILKARNGQEIARSKTFASRAEAEQSIAFLVDTVPGYEQQYVKKRTPRAQSVGNVYAFDQMSTSGERGFESLRHPETKQHFFHFNDDEGKALLFSQGYSSTKSRDNGIRSVIKNASSPAQYESKEHNGKFYFILRASNRQEIAQSRFFGSAAERDRWLTFFQGAIPGYAGAYGVSITTTQASTETESFTLAAPLTIPDVPVPPPVAEVKKTAPPPVQKPAPVQEKRSYVAAKQEEEEDLAYAGEDDRGGFRLWLPWIIGLIAVALILFWLLSMLDGCGGTRGQIAGADNEGTSQQQIVNAGPEEALAEETTTEETTTEEPVTASSAGSGSTGEPPPPLGPTAAALGFSDGSVEGQIANLLSTPGRTLPASFVLNDVNFPRHSAKLNKSAYDQVDNLIKLMQAYPGIHIKFAGHIDGSEDDGIARAFMAGENITLSAVRARCLYQKFVEGGISANQLAFEGLGATSPLVNNNTEANKQKNRRLEVIISE